MFSLFLFFLGIGVWGSSPGPSKCRGRRFTGFCIFAALVCIVTAGTRVGVGVGVVGLLLAGGVAVLAGRGGFFSAPGGLRPGRAGASFGGAFFFTLYRFQG